MFNADPDKWFFLTSDLPQVQRFGRAIDVPAAFKTHSRSLVLVDKEGKLRGQFRYNDAADIARLKAELPNLLAEPSGSQDPVQKDKSKNMPDKGPAPASADGDQAA